MIARKIYGANVLMKGDAAAGVGDLPVLVAPSGLEGVNLCSSAWEPTPEELARLNAGASVILTILGGQPAVCLGVSELVPDDVDGE